MKSGTSGCGSFVVPYFQPATSSIDHLHNDRRDAAMRSSSHELKDIDLKAFDSSVSWTGWKQESRVPVNGGSGGYG